ncbi:MAG TPA: porin [Candidatus Methylomirabilis sp.]|nr:porin [Candidatus Methylomirabilis sp.]
MRSTRVLRSLVALIAAIVTVCSYSAASFAQSADQSQEAKIRVLQERIDALSKELKSMSEEQAKTTKSVATVDKAWNTFIKGFFGTMDVSIDETTKGMSDMIAYHWGSAPNGGPPYVNNGAKSPPGPYGRVSWMPMMSSNGSNVGYRGSHKIGTSGVDFIYQVSTAIDMAAAPGLNNTWTKSSNTVQGAIGLGDTYVGLRNREWGTLKFGEMYSPYKTSTDRLNPFNGLLGNYSVIMGNTGGDNRVESARAWTTWSSTTRPTCPDLRSICPTPSART